MDSERQATAQDHRDARAMIDVEARLEAAFAQAARSIIAAIGADQGELRGNMRLEWSEGGKDVRVDFGSGLFVTTR